MNSEMPLFPPARRNLGQHQVHDVVGELVLGPEIHIFDPNSR